MRVRIPITLAEPTVSINPINSRERTTYTNYRAYADVKDRVGNERLYGEVEADEASSIFTLTWPYPNKRITIQWDLYDEFNVKHDIKSVTPDPKNWAKVNLLATRLTDASAIRAPVPTPSDVPACQTPVSYTHLTLPTICSV